MDISKLPLKNLISLSIIKQTQSEVKGIPSTTEKLAYGICNLHANDNAVHQVRLPERGNAPHDCNKRLFPLHNLRGTQHSSSKLGSIFVDTRFQPVMHDKKAFEETKKECVTL